MEEAPVANRTVVGHASAMAKLRASIDKHDPHTVDHVGLDACQVHHLLYLRHPNHIVIRRSTYLAHAQPQPQPQPQERFEFTPSIHESIMGTTFWCG